MYVSFQKSLRAEQGLGDKQRIASTLEAIAMTACGQGDHERAVFLFSTGDSILRAGDIPRLASDQHSYDLWLSEARSRLDKDRFQALWAQGANVTVEQAIAYAAAHFPA